MRLMMGLWGGMLARRHPATFLATYPRARKVGRHHLSSTLFPVAPAAVPLNQGRTITLIHSVCLLPKWSHDCWRLGSRQPARCFHTEEKNSDHVTSSMEEQSSSSSSSSLCTSNLVWEVVRHWTQSLDTAEVPEAFLSAQHIITHVLGITRSELQQPKTAATALTELQLTEVERLMTCRLARMPLQYILGEWDFHRLTLKVLPPVFIPRPETEQLVELAIENLRELEAPKVLEIGCGSGAISLAILHALPQVECVAVDQSQNAVELTKANASRLKLSDRLTVVTGKVTATAHPPLPHSSYDLIVSNPPYVLRKDLMEVRPEIMMYEDLRALDGGKDGLDVVKVVMLHAHHLLLPGQKLLLEVDSCHPYLLPAWLEKQQLDLKLLRVHRDFNKEERFMEFVKSH